jgi:hypothetical protein
MEIKKENDEKDKVHVTHPSGLEGSAHEHKHAAVDGALRVDGVDEGRGALQTQALGEVLDLHPSYGQTKWRLNEHFFQCIL